VHSPLLFAQTDNCSNIFDYEILRSARRGPPCLPAGRQVRCGLLHCKVTAGTANHGEHCGLRYRNKFLIALFFFAATSPTSSRTSSTSYNTPQTQTVWNDRNFPGHDRSPFPSSSVFLLCPLPGRGVLLNHRTGP